jgi:hypothetical protein
VDDCSARHFSSPVAGLNSIDPLGLHYYDCSWYGRVANTNHGAGKK